MNWIPAKLRMRRVGKLATGMSLRRVIMEVAIEWAMAQNSNMSVSKAHEAPWRSIHLKFSRKPIISGTPQSKGCFARKPTLLAIGKP
jgi:hypothetical protein